MVVETARERNFSKTALLSRFQMPTVIPVIEVIRALNRAKVSFVLVGAYGLAGWRKESRATEVVDVVVAARHLKKAVDVLLREFPVLEAVDLPVVVRLRDRESHDVLIDVMKPVQQPYREVFKHVQRERTEGQTYRVPSLEMALTMKFAAMTSLYRATEDKYRDAHDFIRMAKNNPDIDLEKLSQLASLIYPEGGKDVLEMVRKALANETLGL